MSVAGVDSKLRRLQLIKGVHRFVLVYEVGNELRVLDQLRQMASDRRIDFDRWDAAILADQLKQNLLTPKPCP